MRLSEIVLVWWNSSLFCVSFTRQLVKAHGHPPKSKLHSQNQNWKMLICECKWAAHQLFWCACVWQMSTTGSVFGTVGTHTIASQTVHWLAGGNVSSDWRMSGLCVGRENEKAAAAGWKSQKKPEKFSDVNRRLKKNSTVLNRKLIFKLDCKKKKKKTDTEGWKMQFCLEKPRNKKCANCWIVLKWDVTVKIRPNLTQHDKLKCPKSVSLTSAASESEASRNQDSHSWANRGKTALSCLRMHEQPTKCVAYVVSPGGVEDTRKGAEIMLSLWLKGEENTACVQQMSHTQITVSVRGSAAK